MEATSDTPSTAVRPYFRYQSWKLRSSARERSSELRAYMKAQPTPVASGPSWGETPRGSWGASPDRYSSTRERAQ